MIESQSAAEVQYLVVTCVLVSRQSSHVRPRITYPRSIKFWLGGIAALRREHGKLPLHGGARADLAKAGRIGRG